MNVEVEYIYRIGCDNENGSGGNAGQPCYHFLESNGESQVIGLAEKNGWISVVRDGNEYNYCPDCKAFLNNPATAISTLSDPPNDHS